MQLSGIYTPRRGLPGAPPPSPAPSCPPPTPPSSAPRPAQLLRLPRILHSTPRDPPFPCLLIPFPPPSLQDHPCLLPSTHSACLYPSPACIHPILSSPSLISTCPSIPPTPLLPLDVPPYVMISLPSIRLSSLLCLFFPHPEVHPISSPLCLTSKRTLHSFLSSLWLPPFAPSVLLLNPPQPSLTFLSVPIHRTTPSRPLTPLPQDELYPCLPAPYLSSLAPTSL